MRRLPASILPFALLSLGGCLVPGLDKGSDDAAAGGGAGWSNGFAAAGTRAMSNAPAAGGFGSSSGGGSEAGLASAGVGGGAGEAGSTGGAGDVLVRCDAHPIPPKSTWSVTASSSSLGSGIESDPLYNPPEHVVDGELNERWASGQPQQDGQWFHVDFGVDVALSHVVLQQGTDIDDYPRGYAISVSERHTDFDAVARAKGHGASVSETVIPLEHAVVGRYMMIKQTGSAPSWWSIAEISVECH